MPRLSDPRKLAVWRERFERLSSSGLSVVAFCAREGISTPSFYLWRKKLRPKGRSRSATERHPRHRADPAEERGRFQQVAVVPTASGMTSTARAAYANRSRSERRRRRRRSAIEPKIGHLKSDHRLGRCFLARLTGDAINAVLAAAASNLRKLLRRLAAALTSWLRNALAACSQLPIAAWSDRILLEPTPVAPHSRLRLGFSA